MHSFLILPEVFAAVHTEILEEDANEEEQWGSDYLSLRLEVRTMQ